VVVDTVKEEPKETPAKKSEEILASVEALEVSEASGVSEPVREEKTIPTEVPEVFEPTKEETVVPVEIPEVSEPISKEVSAPVRLSGI